MMTYTKTLALALVTTLAVTGCANQGGAGGGMMDGMTGTQKGGLIGALGGAAAGALIGNKHRGRGALIGAVGGGLAGAAIGNYMERQKRELDMNLSQEVQAGNVFVEQFPDKSIKVIMTAATSFDSGSYTIKSGFYPTMNKIANILVKYPKTALTVTGHTDSKGSHATNQVLSETRARSVSTYLFDKGVVGDRLAAEGRGQVEPRATNATEQGRAQNRRVEIYISPIAE